MKQHLNWKNEEEGSITFLEDDEAVFTADVFLTGEEEAEFRIQDIVFLEKNAENGKISKKVIQKVTKYLLECFRLLWAEGLEEVALVEPCGTILAEILDSTEVVDLAYKEYMMKRCLPVQKTTDCGQSTLKLTKEEQGFCCENAEHTFFCRLLEYGQEAPGENCFYLFEVEVSEKVRNQGIATACMEELFRFLSAKTPTVIYLQVGSYNEPAVHLYEKLGFTIAEELRYYGYGEE